MSSSPVCSCLACPAERVSHRLEQAVGLRVLPVVLMTDVQRTLIDPLLPPAGDTGGRGGRPEAHPAAECWMRSCSWRLAGSPGPRCPGVPAAPDRVRACSNRAAVTQGQCKVVR